MLEVHSIKFLASYDHFDLLSNFASGASENLTSLLKVYIRILTKLVRFANQTGKILACAGDTVREEVKLVVGR